MASSATTKGVSPLDSLFLSRIEHIISKEQWLTKDPTSDLRQASRARYRPTLCAARQAPAGAAAVTRLASSPSLPEAPRCSRHKPMILALVLLLLLICVVLVGSAQAPRRQEAEEEEKE